LPQINTNFQRFQSNTPKNQISVPTNQHFTRPSPPVRQNVVIAQQSPQIIEHLKQQVQHNPQIIEHLKQQARRDLLVQNSGQAGRYFNVDIVFSFFLLL